MATQTKRNQLSVAVGAALTMTLAAVPMADAHAANPFGLTELASGYMLASSAATNPTAEESEAKDGEGSCGEGRCGADAADSEGNCGAHADDAAATDGEVAQADGDEDKDGEGKCGEGRCGGA